MMAEQSAARVTFANVTVLYTPAYTPHLIPLFRDPFPSSGESFGDTSSIGSSFYNCTQIAERGFMNAFIIILSKSFRLMWKMSRCPRTVHGFVEEAKIMPRVQHILASAREFALSSCRSVIIFIILLPMYQIVRFASMLGAAYVRGVTAAVRIPSCTNLRTVSYRRRRSDSDRGRGDTTYRCIIFNIRTLRYSCTRRAESRGTSIETENCVFVLQLVSP